MLLLLLGSESHSHARYVHDLRVGVDRLPPALLLAHQGLQDSHHLRVVKDARLASRGLPLRGEQDHQGRLGAGVDALLILNPRAWCSSLSSCLGAWSTVWGWRGACLDGRDLSLDDVLQVLRD